MDEILTGGGLMMQDIFDLLLAVSRQIQGGWRLLPVIMALTILWIALMVAGTYPQSTFTTTILGIVHVNNANIDIVLKYIAIAAVLVMFILTLLVSVIPRQNRRHIERRLLTLIDRLSIGGSTERERIYLYGLRRWLAPSAVCGLSEKLNRGGDFLRSDLQCELRFQQGQITQSVPPVTVWLVNAMGIGLPATLGLAYALPHITWSLWLLIGLVVLEVGVLIPLFAWLQLSGWPGLELVAPWETLVIWVLLAMLTLVIYAHVTSTWVLIGFVATQCAVLLYHEAKAAQMRERYRMTPFEVLVKIKWRGERKRIQRSQGQTGPNGSSGIGAGGNY